MMIWISSHVWNELMSKVDDISVTVDIIDRRTKKMAKSLDDIISDITDLRSRTAGLITLTNGIKAQLDAILAGTLTPEQQAKVDAIFQAVEDDKTDVQAAIDANTSPVTPAAR